MSEYTPEDLELRAEKMRNGSYQMLVTDEAMLRAGAQAIRDRDEYKRLWGTVSDAHDGLSELRKNDLTTIANLEARVKVLEEIVQKYVACWDKFMRSDRNHADAYYAFVKGHYDDEDKARAALQVKP